MARFAREEYRQSNSAVVVLVAVLSTAALLAMASRFTKRHAAGENVDAELTAIGDELDSRGEGRDVEITR